MKYVLCILLFFLIPVGAQEIVWKEKELSYKAKLNEKLAKFNFRFTSSREISVEKIYTACDCVKIVTATPVKVAAGTEGQIELIYNLEGRTGLNTTSVEVVVSGEKVTLTLTAEIPQAVEISPRFVVWKKGENESKEVSVKIHPDWQGKITDAKSQTPDIKAEMIKSENGFLIKIAPPSNPDRGRQRFWLSLQGTDEDGKVIDEKIYLMLN